MGGEADMIRGDLNGLAFGEYAGLENNSSAANYVSASALRCFCVNLFANLS